RRRYTGLPQPARRDARHRVAPGCLLPSVLRWSIPGLHSQRPTAWQVCPGDTHRAWRRGREQAARVSRESAVMENTSYERRRADALIQTLDAIRATYCDGQHGDPI